LTTPNSGRPPEVRSRYVLEAGPRKVKGQSALMRDVLVYDACGFRSVAVVVPNTVAIDVLEAVRAAYQQGREDHAQEQDERQA
jgi:hypothetical protein